MHSLHTLGPLLATALLVALPTACAESGAPVPEALSPQELQAQYPEIFEIVESFDCGESLDDLLGRIPAEAPAVAKTVNTVGSVMEFRQGAVRFIVVADDYVVSGPFVDGRKTASGSRSLCPLVVLPPDYVGGTVLLDGEETTTVSEARTPLTVPPGYHEVRVVREGLQEVVETVSARHELTAFLLVDDLDTVFLRLIVPRQYAASEIILDGASLGELRGTRILTELAPGDHQVRAVRDGLPGLEKEIAIEGDRLVEEVSLRPPSP